MAAYTMGRHFAQSVRIRMQESSNLLLRYTLLSPEITRNHLGYLHAGVFVVNNERIDNAGHGALKHLMEAMDEARVQPPPPEDPMTPDQDPPRGDPFESDVLACALRLRP